MFNSLEVILQFDFHPNKMKEKNKYKCLFVNIILSNHI